MGVIMKHHFSAVALLAVALSAPAFAAGVEAVVKLDASAPADASATMQNVKSKGAEMGHAAKANAEAGVDAAAHAGHKAKSTAEAKVGAKLDASAPAAANVRSEEHTSELQSLMRISYAVFCLKNKKKTQKSRKTKRC